MVVELDDGESWEYTPPGEQTHILFASASSPDQPVLSVHLNRKLVDRVYLTAPHSWWSATNQSICGQTNLLPNDKLNVSVKGGKAALRIDLEEF